MPGRPRAARPQTDSRCGDRTRLARLMDMKMWSQPTAATEPTAVPVPTAPAGLRSGGQGVPHAMTISAGPAAVVAPPAGAYHLDPVRSAVSLGTRHLFGLGAV